MGLLQINSLWKAFAFFKLSLVIFCIMSMLFHITRIKCYCFVLVTLVSPSPLRYMICQTSFQLVYYEPVFVFTITRSVIGDSMSYYIIFTCSGSTTILHFTLDRDYAVTLTLTSQQLVNSKQGVGHQCPWFVCKQTRCYFPVQTARLNDVP